MHLRLRRLSGLLLLFALVFAFPTRAAGGVMITEFLAGNQGGLADEDGEFSDWIEIHNPGTNTVNLLGYYLTDSAGDLRKWRFPSLSLEPLEYFVVFASGKNRALPCSELHANFTLNQAGEYLALVSPDGVTVVSSFSPGFPPQHPGISYGTPSPIVANSQRFFDSPTPNAPNGSGLAGVTEPVQFSKVGGIYTNSIELSLAVASAQAVIRYTLDGAEPTESSPAYTAPIPISQSTVVKAKVFQADLISLPGVSQTYTLLDEGLRNFTSNLPLVVINAFGREITGVGTDFQVSARFIDAPTNGRSSLLRPANHDGRGTMAVRGSSSSGFPKKQYHFTTRNDQGASVDVPVLGFPAESDWVLYAPYSEKSLMQNFLAYELSGKMGHYAVRTKYVEVFLDSSGGNLGTNDYLGVYIWMEKIKRDDNRVNIAKMGPKDNAEPEVTGGYIFKKDRLGPGESGVITGSGVVLAYVEPSETLLTSAQKNWFNNHLSQFERALYGADFKDPVEGYAKYIDADSFIDQQWIVEMAKNIDGYRLSNFMHKDRGGKIKMDPIWDWNLSFGNANYLEGGLPNNWYWPQLSNVDYPWFRRLFEDPDFNQKFVDRWGELRTNVFLASNVLARVDELAAYLDEAQVRNFQRWPILGAYVWPNFYVGTNYADDVGWMKWWIQERLSWIDSQFLRAPTFGHPGGLVAPGFALEMNAGNGTIYYTLDGTDPRKPGGDPSPNALVYSAPVALTANARVFARQWSTGGTWSPPTVASFWVSAPPLALTEIMYHPLAGPAGSPYPQEDYEYVVLQNIGPGELSLAGMRFTDGITFDFSGGAITRLGPGQRVVLVKNLAAFRSRYVADNVAGEYSGNLANSSDRLTLLGPLREILADFTYQDTWHPLTDGKGYALRRKAPATTGYEDPAAWEAALPGFAGSPVGATAPVITVQPVSQSVLALADVTFSVVVQGDAPWSYQWQFNGANLPGATSPTLSLKGVQYLQGGRYSVVIFDPLRAMVSAPAHLDVTYPAVILRQPASVTAVLGNTASFSVNACSDTPLSYQWKWNGQDIPGATSSNLVFSPVQVTNAGTYSVRIRGTLGEISSQSVDLTVLVKPVFVLQPQAQTVVAGDTVVFTAAVTGTAPFGYRWRRNGVTVVPFGVGGPSLTLTNVTTSQAGTYSVVVSNSAAPGGVLSASVALSVLQDTDGDHLPDAWETANGLNSLDPDDAGLDGDGDGMTNAQEYAAGTQPGNAQSLLKLIGPGISSGVASLQFLALSNRTYGVEWKESLEYGRWARLIDVPSRSTNRVAVVLDPYPMADGRCYRLATPRTAAPSPGPVLLRSPRSVVTSVGDDVELSVFAQGAGDLSYQWSFNGLTIAGATGSRLLFHRVQPDQSGFYGVRVTDTSGVTTNEPPAVLTVRPQILIQPQSQQVGAGGTAEFSVTASSSEPLTYRWTRNGKVILGEVGSTLRLVNVQANQAGEYRVTVSHQTPLGMVGVTSSVALLTLR